MGYFNPEAQAHADALEDPDYIAMAERKPPQLTFIEQCLWIGVCALVMATVAVLVVEALRMP